MLCPYAITAPINQGNRIFRERHKYCGESSKGKRAVVTARRLACVTEDDL